MEAMKEKQHLNNNSFYFKKYMLSKPTATATFEQGNRIKK